MTKRNVIRNARHNERKLPILEILIKSRRYLKAEDIAALAGITKNNAWRQMTKLSGQGYVWRRKINGIWRYRRLKPMGIRVLKALWIRKRMRLLTGDDSIPMNLKKRVPFQYSDIERRAREQFEIWLYEE
jgi:hypothetical protein